MHQSALPLKLEDFKVSFAPLLQGCVDAKGTCQCELPHNSVFHHASVKCCLLKWIG